MFRRLDHVALHVTDAAARARFYTETFGFKKVFDAPGTGGHPIIYIQLGDSMIELTQRDAAEPMSGFHLCLQPADFDAAMAALQARNLPLVTDARPTSPRGPREEGWRRAVFRGPEGELIEIRG